MTTIRVAFQNRKGILGKKFELQHYIQKEELDLALRSETHLRSCHQLNAPNFINCMKNKEQGMALLTKSTLKNKSLPTSQQNRIKTTGI